jgi:exodeoxyribonuclease V alpha subunit
MTLDQIDIVIGRVAYHKPSPYSPAGLPFLIARTVDGRTIKGTMRRAVEGHAYRLWGAWRQQKPYRDNLPEQAFEFIHHEPLIRQCDDGIVEFLSGHIDGIGSVKAGAIVATFGPETLAVLRREPERAAAEVRGPAGTAMITEANVQAIRDYFETELDFDPAAYARLVELFHEAAVRVPRKVVLKLLEFWGSSAPEIVAERPYLLLALPGMGWKTVDTFAQSPAVGYDPRGLARQRAAILEALERISDEGHTHADRVDIEEQVFALLGHLPAPEAWDDLLRRGLIELDEDDGTWTLPALAEAERTIAERLRLLAERATPLEFELRSDRLNQDQRAALAVIQEHGVAILAGPPGVGKSHTMAALVKCMINNAVTKIVVVAPTGKASKRAKELIDAAVPGNTIPCSTIHKALGPTPSGEPEGVPSEDARVGRGREGFTFKHGLEDQLNVDYMIVDETSMVPASLMASLLDAVPPGARVLFVGDQNQLPSVGPGSVLRDMIDAGVPTAMLTRIVRSDGGGRIVRACHAIKDGLVPEPAAAPPRLPTENWCHIEESDPQRIAEIIAGLCRPYASFPDPVWDIQVVSAQHERPGFGCRNLNRLLSARLNPPPVNGSTGLVGHVGDRRGTQDDQAFDDEDDAPAVTFLTGDKVIRRKNGLADQMVLLSKGDIEDGLRHTDWTWRGQPYRFTETAVVNGDMGTVEDIVAGRGERQSWVVVRFRNPERLCRLAYGECHLQRAYAITGHSAQGSGFPLVIIPVHRTFYWDARTGNGIWSREEFYTLISRAEVAAITVGEFAAIPLAVSRPTIGRRRTRLRGLIEATRNPVEI